MILYKLGLVDVEVETNVIVEESGAPSRAKELHYSNAPDNSPINIIDVNVIAAGKPTHHCGSKCELTFRFLTQLNCVGLQAFFRLSLSLSLFLSFFLSLFLLLSVCLGISFFASSRCALADSVLINVLLLFLVCVTEPKVGASQSVVGVYSAETFAIAVVVACFASLIVGFLSGLMFSRRCKLEEYSGGFNGAPYLEQRRLSRLNETMTAHQNIEPSKMNNFIDNQPTSLVKMANEKNSNAVTTLDMKPVQKVKKTYV